MSLPRTKKKKEKREEVDMLGDELYFLKFVKHQRFYCGKVSAFMEVIIVHTVFTFYQG